jgi:hypothetical protein
MAPPYQGYSNQMTKRGTSQKTWDDFNNLYRTNKANRDEEEAAQYSKSSDNVLSQGIGLSGGLNFTSPYVNPMDPKKVPMIDPRNMLFSSNLEKEEGYGGLFGKIGEYGGKAMDWFGKQEVPELMKMGLGIKEHFFDRPKMIDSYLKQGSALNALRNSQMAAIDENIAGAKRAEARTTAMQLRNLNSQRPQGTPEFTQLTPSTYV